MEIESQRRRSECILDAAGPAMRAFLRIMRIWRRRRATRRRLRELDARELVDIGRCEGERRLECGKWFWQP
jgi:uncharacterized protein YjiS (DUF1127 family)